MALTPDKKKLVFWIAKELALQGWCAEPDILQDLKKALKCSRQHAYKYIKYAKKLILKWTKRPLEAHQADSYVFLTKIMYDNTSPLQYRLIAQKQLASLLGLNAPKKIDLNVENPIFNIINQQILLNHPEYADSIFSLAAAQAVLPEIPDRETSPLPLSGPYEGHGYPREQDNHLDASPAPENNLVKHPAAGVGNDVRPDDADNPTIVQR